MYRDTLQVDWKALVPSKLALPPVLHPNQDVKLSVSPSLIVLHRPENVFVDVKLIRQTVLERVMNALEYRPKFRGDNSPSN